MRVLALLLLMSAGCRTSYSSNIRLPVTATPVGVEGVWQTRWSGQRFINDASLSLTQRGDAVTGIYSTHETPNGRLDGRLQGNELLGDWWEDDRHGRFRFVFDATATRFEGTWGVADFDDNGGVWEGSRAVPP